MKLKKLLVALFAAVMFATILPLTASAEEVKNNPQGSGYAQTLNSGLSSNGVVCNLKSESCRLSGPTSDNDKMFSQYVDVVFENNPGNVTYGTLAGSRLSGPDKKFYNAVKAEATKIANGERTSTIISIPLSKFTSSTTIKASEFGYSSINDYNAQDIFNAWCAKYFDIDLSKVYNALDFDLAYELYWHDKTIGVSYDVTAGNNPVTSIGKTTMTLNPSYGYKFYMHVSKDFKGSSTYSTNPNKTSAAKKAKANAASIVASASGSDYDKIQYYFNKVSGLSEYNYDAVNYDYDYGNPWQMIWVFDGDPSTKVVCEGYSKAFQYLCDKTKFASTKTRSILVTGDMSYYLGGYGPHMWNVVRMNDGKNYTIDATNGVSLVDAPATSGTNGGLYYTRYNVPSAGYYYFTLDKYTQAAYSSASYTIS
ncbi:MAG: hypothetical protein Q4C42_11070, partial [Clostridia bacterium]|nr:hypothetical protein [Clostridia bacterium]